MRRCIRSILLSVTLFSVLSSAAEACFFFPLFDPLNWCVGHHNPYATYRVIDDWLGYGYLRGQQNGSLGHYPGRPWNCYTPMYPQLSRPWTRPLPGAAPFGMPMHGLGTMPSAPMYSAPVQAAPYMAQQWNIGPTMGDCGCGESAAPFTAMPSMPWGGDGCGCDTAMMQPMAVQVPVTTYRPVTVDRGHFQMVWVPRPVTQMVPQTSWQTQYLQQPQTPYMPMAPAMPMGSPCGDTPCSDGTGVPMSTSMPVPALTGYSPNTVLSHGMATSMGSPSTNAMTAFRPAYAAAPYQGMIPNYGTPQQYGAISGYGFAGQTPSAQFAANPYYGSANVAYQQAPGTSNPYAGYGTAAWNPAGSMPGASLYGSGDVWGDHEIPGIAPYATGSTAMVPVTPNSYQGMVPVRRASFSTPVRSASARKYPNSVW